MSRRWWRHPAFGTLMRDRFVRTYAATFVATVGVYVAPAVPRPFLEYYGQAAYLAPFVALALLSAISDLPRVADREERRFWRAIGACCLFWLAGIVLYAIESGRQPSRIFDVAIGATYLMSYLPLLMAVEWRPHDGVPLIPWEPDRWAHVVTAALLAGGWYGYFVGIPAWFDEAFYGSAIPALLLYLVLDVLIVSLYLFVGRRCPVPRWRVIYGAVGLATLAITVTDLLDLLVDAGILGWVSGRLTDMWWCLPSFAFVVAIRLRHAPLPETVTVEAGPTGFSLEERARSGAFVLAGGFSFPLVHLWFQGIVPLSPELQQAQGALVLTMLILFAGVAVITYGLLGRRHRELEEVRQGLLQRLRESQRLEAVGRLAGGVAHDFNNMLTSIVGYNDMALDGLPEDDPNRASLEQIAQAAGRAAELTHQLLALSRRQILKPERVNLSTLIGDFGPTLARVIGEDVRLELRLSPDLKDVVADPSQMRSVVLTLAANARDAMPKGGVVAIGTANVRLTRESHPIDPTRQAGGYVELRVRDTGAPIADDARAHLFEPFSQVASKGRGAGLGLAAVHGIVTQSAGRIDVANGPHGGVEFVIRLPRAGDGGSPTPPPAATR
jgi:signal transduction histidine kinase